jgi:AcrR family transcriptional regulator
MKTPQQHRTQTHMPEINELLPREDLEGMSRRERKKQETRWRIYEAAMSLFARQEYDSVKIEDICEEADVSNAAFFHHFTNKASVIRAYLDQLKTNIREKLDAAENASSTEKLELINREVMKTIEETAFVTAQMFAAITSGDARLDMEHIDTGIKGTLAEIIREGQSSGEFNKSCQPEVVAISLVSSWVMLPLAAKAPSFPKKPHDKLLNFFLAGLKNGTG